MGGGGGGERVGGADDCAGVLRGEIGHCGSLLTWIRESDLMCGGLKTIARLGSVIVINFWFLLLCELLVVSYLKLIFDGLRLGYHRVSTSRA